MGNVFKSVPRPKPFDWIYWGVFFGCLVPLALIVFGLLTGSLNFGKQLKVIYNQMGYVGLLLLLASLACTPIRLIFKAQWPARLRKMLGLFGFMYVCLHAFTYTGFDQGLAYLPYEAWTKNRLSLHWLASDYWGEVKRVASEIFSLNKIFLLFGVCALALLLPLAATSTNGMLRRLGGKRWQALHRLAYVIGILGVLHFYLGIKSPDKTEAWVLGGMLAVLLGVRLWKRFSKKHAA